MGSASKKTASICTSEKAERTHVFSIDGYSLKKGMGVGRFVRSAAFTVGGYDWSVRFYPDGSTVDTEDCVSIILEFRSKDAEARSFINIGLVDQSSGSLGWRLIQNKMMIFHGYSQDGIGHLYLLVLRRLSLEKTKYIQDDRLVIECGLTVVKESQVYDTKGEGGCSEISVPPSNITEHFAKLLEAKEGADVTFSVGGETFKAHKIFLATRSPVFKAELYGPMRETRMLCVTIEDMQPAVFRALLHFIYTDSLPNFDDLEGDDYCEMIRHLLAAADRYAVDRLKMICQNILGKKLDVESVATTLALADQHNCDKLNDVCIEFVASSSDKMDAVMETKGYANLKRFCPSVLVDVLEKTRKSRKA